MSRRPMDLVLTAPPMTEHEEQVTLIKALRREAVERPAFGLVYAVPNGGWRNLTVAVKLKAEGVLPGVPDLVLPAPRRAPDGSVWGACYVELKGRGGRPTETQKGLHSDLRVQGNYVGVCVGWEEALATFRWYEALPTP